MTTIEREYRDRRRVRNFQHAATAERALADRMTKIAGHAKTMINQHFPDELRWKSISLLLRELRAIIRSSGPTGCEDREILSARAEALSVQPERIGPDYVDQMLNLMDDAVDAAHRRIDERMIGGTSQSATPG